MNNVIKLILAAVYANSFYIDNEELLDSYFQVDKKNHSASYILRDYSFNGERNTVIAFRELHKLIDNFSVSVVDPESGLLEMRLTVNNIDADLEFINKMYQRQITVTPISSLKKVPSLKDLLDLYDEQQRKKESSNIIEFPF